MKISDDIYAYEWKNYFDNNCNSFYIGGRINTLIDPGLKAYLPSLLDDMEKDGIDRGEIRYVINTHSHPDHFEGSISFYNTDVKIGLHEEEILFLTGNGAALYHLFNLKPPVPNIDISLKEGTIILGDGNFEIIHIPGHSPGSIALFWPDRKALFSGDVIFSQNVGRTDFPGGNGAQLKQSIKKLSMLDVDALFPGHMGIIEGTERVKKNFQMVINHVLPYI